MWQSFKQFGIRREQVLLYPIHQAGAQRDWCVQHRVSTFFADSIHAHQHAGGTYPRCQYCDFAIVVLTQRTPAPTLIIRADTIYHSCFQFVLCHSFIPNSTIAPMRSSGPAPLSCPMPRVGASNERECGALFGVLCSRRFGRRFGGHGFFSRTTPG